MFPWRDFYTEGGEEEEGEGKKEGGSRVEGGEREGGGRLRSRSKSLVEIPGIASPFAGFVVVVVVFVIVGVIYCLFGFVVFQMFFLHAFIIKTT